MSEPRQDIDGQDELVRGLRGLVRTDGEVPPGGAGAAVRTVRRRVAGRVAGGAVLVAALVVGVPLGLSLGTTTAAPVPVATQAPSVEAPEPTAQVTGSSTDGVEPGPSAAPMPSGRPAPPAPSDPPAPPAPSDAPVTPTPSVLEVSASSSGPSRAGELADLELPLPSSVAAGAVSGATGPATWPFDPCGAGTHPDDDLRTGWAARSMATGGDVGRVEQAVASYATELEARNVLESFAELAGRCLDGPQGPPGQLWQTVELSSERLSGTQRTYAEPSAQEQQQLADGGAFLRDGSYVAAVRVGRHVAVLVRTDESAGTFIAGTQGDYRPGAGVSGDLSLEAEQAFVTDDLGSVSSDADRLASAAAELSGPAG